MMGGEKERLARIRIGSVIRETREYRGLSIRDLAEMVDMSKNNVHRIEQGRYNYTIDNLLIIARALDLDLWIA